MDPVFCTAIVDFNVPGQSKRPPGKLKATVWTLLHTMPLGESEKYSIEFTDPSGKMVGSSKVPVNAWVQTENVIETSEFGTFPERCIRDSPMLFRDLHDDNQKLVSLDQEYEMTIAPFGGVAFSVRDGLVSALFAILGPQSLFFSLYFCIYLAVLF